MERGSPTTDLLLVGLSHCLHACLNLRSRRFYKASLQYGVQTKDVRGDMRCGMPAQLLAGTSTTCLSPRPSRPQPSTSPLPNHLALAHRSPVRPKHPVSPAAHRHVARRSVGNRDCPARRRSPWQHSPAQQQSDDATGQSNSRRRTGLPCLEKERVASAAHGGGVCAPSESRRPVSCGRLPNDPRSRQAQVPHGQSARVRPCHGREAGH